MSRNIELMVVDDEPSVLKAISEQLSLIAKEARDNLNIIMISSATQATRNPKWNNVDCLLVDYRLNSGESGLQLLERVSDPFEQLFVVLISGYNEEELRNVIGRLQSRFGIRFRFLRKTVETIEFRALYSALKQFVEGRPLPHPFAFLLQRYQGSEGMKAFWEMVSLVECFLKYAVAIVINDFARLGILNRICLPIDIAGSKSLGKWIRLGETLKTEYALVGKDTFMPSLLAWDNDASSPNAMFEFFWRLNGKRNEELAHGFSQPDEWYKELMIAETKTIAIFIDGLRLFSRYPLLVPEKVSFVTDQDAYNYDVRLLMGPGAYFESKSIQIADRLTDGEIHVHSLSGPSLSLSPFLAFRLCKECKSKKIAFLQTVTRDEFVYKAAFCNHLIEVSGGMKALRQRFPQCSWAKQNDS